MRPIRKIASSAKSSWSTIRRSRLYSALDNINFQSGLGDSAYLLYGLVRSSKPQVVVEIGSARGRSACFMGMALRENRLGRLYAIDPHIKTAWNDEESVDTYDVFASNVRKLGLQGYVEILRNASNDVARSWNLPIDILFIDGDHSYEGVKRDWELFSPFVRPFGQVVFHDTLWDLKRDSKYFRPNIGVPLFVDELREQGFPIITLDKDFGVSLVQPTRNGVGLRGVDKQRKLQTD